MKSSFKTSGDVCPSFLIQNRENLIVSFQTRMVNGKCLLEYAWDGAHVEDYFKFFVVLTYITTYLAPVLAMAVL